jgi:hypothetical protein
MAVLIEAISVVVRLGAIFERFPEGWEGFKAAVPNGTLCSDNELARIGFMTVDDVEPFIKKLESNHLIHLGAGEAVDVVVVDQQAGPMNKCSWIEFGHLNLGGNPKTRVAACRFKGSSTMQVFTPEGWKFEHSLSHTYGFVPAGSEAKSLTFLRQQDGLDVYRNELTGTDVYVGRTPSSPLSVK